MSVTDCVGLGEGVASADGLWLDDTLALEDWLDVAVDDCEPSVDEADENWLGVAEGEADGDAEPEPEDEGDEVDEGDKICAKAADTRNTSSRRRRISPARRGRPLPDYTISEDAFGWLQDS